MRFHKRLFKEPHDLLWQEYCGFLDLTLDEYMRIQTHLLKEQLSLMAASPLGRRFFKDGVPDSVSSFRELVPLTDYGDYADSLLMRSEEILPARPLIWLETTWEGGAHSRKAAPYSAGMLDSYRRNMLAVVILANASQKGDFQVLRGARVLYTLAPLPYATGLFPEIMKDEMDFHFMPPLKEALSLPFSQQMARGFEQALKGGMDYFFGLSSILYYISGSLLTRRGGGLSKLSGFRPRMLYRLLRARYRSQRDGNPLLPKDVFQLKSLVCVGNDSTLYKGDLERFWGVRPMEIMAGTEPSLIGTETWLRDGLVLFPDACFYEFIPEDEMWRSLDEPGYVPRTYLINELSPGRLYELVITVLRGGAFMRYRVGDVYRCLRLKNPAAGLDIPQFEFVDRRPDVIDIGGFTRITAHEIDKVIQLSGLQVARWCALKAYDENNHAYLQLYVELDEEEHSPTSAQVIQEHLSVYFRFHDSDYASLKRLIKLEPLQVDLVAPGAFGRFEKSKGRTLRRMNPPTNDVLDFRLLCGFQGKGAVNPWQ